MASAVARTLSVVDGQRVNGPQPVVGEQRFQRGPAPGIRPAGQVGACTDQVEADEVGRPLPRGRLRGPAAPCEALLEPIEREPAGLPHHDLAVYAGVRRQLGHGGGADVGERRPSVPGELLLLEPLSRG
jgi:hypothetical protein